MIEKMTNWLLIAVVFAGVNTATVWAKDTFYYIGYGLIQVVDGEIDAIVADIPVHGWLRETDFSADGKFLYVTANLKFHSLEASYLTRFNRLG